MYNIQLTGKAGVLVTLPTPKYYGKVLEVYLSFSADFFALVTGVGCKGMAERCTREVQIRY